VRTKPYDLLPIFRSRLQAELLAMLFLNSDERVTGPELQDRSGASEPTLRRHLIELENAGLIHSERMGRTKRYRAATDSPLFEPLKELLDRTVGVERILAARLADVSGIESAAIFGSWASGGSLRSDSDIDVLVIGEVDLDELADVAADVERIASREINFVTYRRPEFDRKLTEGSGFAVSVMGSALKPLIGDPRSPVKSRD